MARASVDDGSNTTWYVDVKYVVSGRRESDVDIAYLQDLALMKLERGGQEKEGVREDECIDARRCCLRGEEEESVRFSTPQVVSRVLGAN